MADDNPEWRPNEYAYDFLGCRMDFKFPMAKLLDFVGKEQELEQSDNPIAIVILAHLKAMETKGDHERRAVWKFRLIKGLYNRGWSKDEVWQLVRLIDWFLKLPPPLEIQFRRDLEALQQEKKMPYVTSFERLAKEEGIAEGKAEGKAEGIAEGEARGAARGLQEGIALALRLKFGAAGRAVAQEISGVMDVTVLRRIAMSIESANTLDDVPRWY